MARTRVAQRVTFFSAVSVFEPYHNNFRRNNPKVMDEYELLLTVKLGIFPKWLNNLTEQVIFSFTNVVVAYTCSVRKLL